MQSEEIIILPLTKEHWKDVRKIFIQGIETKNATFETKCPTWKQWDKAHRKDCRLAASINGKVAGWVALSNVSERCCYKGVAEISIYIGNEYKGKGVGNKLMEAVISDSEKAELWTLQAGIFKENVASIKLHKKHGFRIVGIREKLGKMGDE
jgi:phosphinothricin acetyltransferase